MSTSLLNRVFGVRDYRYVKTEYQGPRTYFHIADDHPQCASCGSENVVRNGRRPREFRLVNAGCRPTFAVLEVPRLGCRDCGAKRQARVRFAEPMKTYSRSFQRLVVELLEQGSISFVAKFLDIGWDLVKDIQKANLRKRFAKPPLKDLTAIAIDEIYLGKTLGYRTLVLDLASGAVVHVGQGKGASALTPFWKRLRASGARIIAVAMDMSKAFVAAVTKNLPQADIVFDPFHVIKLMNERLDDLRRELWREATREGKQAIKGTRWLLLRGGDKISNESRRDDQLSDQERLEAALSLNQPLATAYYLKEDLRMLWVFDDFKSGRGWLRDWLKDAQASGIPQMLKMAKTVRAHEKGILNYFKHKITSGPMEGTNNKVRTMMKQTYGLRDVEYLELRIKSLHEMKLRLAGRL